MLTHTQSEALQLLFHGLTRIRGIAHSAINQPHNNSCSNTMNTSAAIYEETNGIYNLPLAVHEPEKEGPNQAVLDRLFHSLVKIRSMANCAKKQTNTSTCNSVDSNTTIYELADSIHNLPLVVKEPEKESRNQNELLIARTSIAKFTC